MTKVIISLDYGIIMTKGVLGIILCPMVDDNLTYSLKKDPEEKHVIVIDNDYCGPIKRKLDAIGQSYELVDWREVVGRRHDFDKERYNIMIYSLDLGLHSKPEFLKSEVERIADEMQPFG